jgi:hypothetical protein
MRFVLLALTLLNPAAWAQARPLDLVPSGGPRALPKRILGASAEPFWEHILDDAEKIAALKPLQLGYTRFPGGSLANYYDWKRGLFFLEPKPDSSAYYRMFARLSQMTARAFPDGIFLGQYQAFSDRIGAEVVLVPNLETATAEDQAEWFRRIAAKEAVPTHIELGNEFWIAMGMDPGVWRRWPDEEASMRIMRRYLEAFRPYLPRGAKIAVQAAAAPSFGDASRRGPVMQRLRRWDEALRPEPWFDAVTVHLYPRLNAILGRPGAADDPITLEIAGRNLQALLARADGGTDNILREVGRRVPGKEIWITEWNPSGAEPVARSRSNPSTPALMLHLVTRMTLAFLRNPQVTICQFYAIYFMPGRPFRAFLPGPRGYQPAPAMLALRWLDEAANGGVTFQRFVEAGGARISGGGLRPETYGAVEAALFRGDGGATLILQNASADSRRWNIPKNFGRNVPSRVERMAMPDLANTVERPADAEIVQPSMEIPVPPYSVTRVIWKISEDRK